jgi:hypothetical protein
MNPPDETYPLGEPVPAPRPVPAQVNAPPHASPPLIPAYAPRSLAPLRPYESAMPRARWVVGLAWATIVIEVLMIGPHVINLRAMRQMQADTAAGVEADYELAYGGDGLYGAGPAADETVGSLLTMLFLALALVGLVFWLTWVHRTYRNLPALGATELKYSPGWAVAYYFIPVLSLFRPLQVMRETWRASHPAHVGGPDWSRVPVPALVAVWWALHLISTIVNRASSRLGARTEDLDALVALAWVDLGMLVFDAVLAYVEIRLVLQITRLQEHRASAPVAVPAPYPAGSNAYYAAR